MANPEMAQMDGTGSREKALSPEEEAILGHGKLAPIRRLVTFLWQVKLRLQFTGWLQYLPFALVALVFLLAAEIARLIGAPAAALPLFGIGALFLVVEVFDLITVKFHLHPQERRPARLDRLNLFDLMRARHSCRSFQVRKLTPEDRTSLMESVRLHSAEPTIGKAPIRFEYISAPLTVWPVVNATEFLVALAPRAYNRLAVLDVGRTLQKMVMDATRMGLGTCWIGPGADHASVIQHLGDRFNPEEDHIICVCAVGYPSAYIPLFIRIFNLQFRRRLPLSALFFADPELTKPLDVDAFPFNRFGRTYEICQWAPSSYNGQTTRCAAVMNEAGGRDSRPGQLARFDFYAATESRYYAPVAAGIWCANWEMGCSDLGIQGHVARLTAAERGLPDEADQTGSPRYDISWVLDEDLAKS